ncbi:MAG: toprim domain-containing protein, partial [Candidatus Adiutrix sp.]
EGFATGASLKLAMDKPVVVAFDSNNLKPVALALSEKYPDAKLIICADNDHNPKTDKNVGLEKAQQAALAVNGSVAVPVFTQEETKAGLTDFNDLHKKHGLKAVSESFSQFQEKEQAVQNKGILSTIKEKFVGQSGGMSR